MGTKEDIEGGAAYARHPCAAAPAADEFRRESAQVSEQHATAVVREAI
jgi:hypothetical protein